MICYNYSGFGHKAQDCWNSKRNPKQEKEIGSTCYPALLKKNIDAVKLKKIWKNKDNPKKIYTNGELKEGQEENKGTRKIVLKPVEVDHCKEDGFHMTSPF